MPINVQFRRSMAAGLAGLTLLALLAACGGETQSSAPTPAGETPTAVASAAQTEATAESATPTTAPTANANDNAAASSDLPVAPVGPTGPASCTPIEIPNNALTSLAKADEWSKGPESAPITLIEYGDFQ
ncbi:MAG: hypothetical protein FOGNACKC_04398 [Anaerolineae bacterium]|nr:hypothetical protein [Anaerolineae bacterium]